MKCPNCKNNIPDDSKFCKHCGQRIEESCGVIKCSNPQCGKEIPSDSKFCPFCGKSLDTANESNQNDFVFPLYDIKLGVTTVAEIADAQQLWDDIEEDEPFCNLKLSSGLTVFAFHSPYNPIIGLEEDWESDDVHRDCWKAILPISPDNTRKEIISWCKNNHLSFIDNSLDGIYILLGSHTFVGISPDDGIRAIMIPPCPKCHKTNVQPESNEDGPIVRCKFCKHKYNLVVVLDTLYPKRDEQCPCCGSSDYTDDGSGHIQYTCKHCGHIWGNEEDEDEDNDFDDNDMKDNEKEEDDGYGEEDWLHRFFPICGITLGETTIHEAEDQEYLYAEIEYEDNGTVIVWTPDDQGRKGAQIRIEKDQNDDTFSNIYITRSEAMFNIWKSFGLDWSLSYNASVSLFKREGFTVYQIEKPHIYKSPNSGSEYFCSSIVAVADDYSIKFKLDFMGKKYDSVNSRNTLYSVSVYSSNFCTNEGDEDFWNIEESREHIEPAILL